MTNKAIEEALNNGAKSTTANSGLDCYCESGASVGYLKNGCICESNALAVLGTETCNCKSGALAIGKLDLGSDYDCESIDSVGAA